VKLACHVKKPIFLHERESHGAVVDILQKHRNTLPGGVVHCFTGGYNELKSYLDLGLFIGVTGKLPTLGVVAVEEIHVLFEFHTVTLYSQFEFFFVKQLCANIKKPRKSREFL